MNEYGAGMYNGAMEERAKIVLSLRYDRSNETAPEVVALYDKIIDKIEAGNY
jgi:hypothetical protein